MRAEARSQAAFTSSHFVRSGCRRRSDLSWYDSLVWPPIGSLQLRALVLLPLLWLFVPPVANGGLLRVEKDGSGDFQVVQDAIDAAAPGDTILVGPGRFDLFRPSSSVVDGSQFQSIAWLTTAGLVLRGSGQDETILGPALPTELVQGDHTVGIYVDGGAPATILDLRVENVHRPVVLRDSAAVTGCSVINPGFSWGLSVLAGAGTTVAGCSFSGPDAISTWTSSVSDLTVDMCTFDDPSRDGLAVAVGNGSQNASVRQCVFTGFAGGVQFGLSASGVVEDCEFREMRVVAVSLSNGTATMRRCRIGPGATLPIRVNIGRLDCFDSVIGGGTIATILSTGEMMVRDCHILNAGGLSVDSGGETFEEMDLSGNWWGTVDESQIANWIRDQNGNVTWRPILQSPVTSDTRSFSRVKSDYGGN